MDEIDIINNKEVYTKLHKILIKYNISFDIVVDCYYKNVVELKIHLLSISYLIIDKYVRRESENIYMKKDIKNWIKKEYYITGSDIKKKTNEYMKKLLMPYTKNIDYSFQKEQIDEYKRLLSKIYFEPDKDPETKIYVEDKSNEGCQNCLTVPCVCVKNQKMGFKEMQQMSLWKPGQGNNVVNYDVLYEGLNIPKIYIPKIDALFRNVITMKKDIKKNKKLIYLYAIYLASNVLLSNLMIHISIKFPKLHNLFSGDKVNQEVIDIFKNYFINYDPNSEYIAKNDAIQYMKLKFNDMYIKKYMDIKKQTSIMNLLTTVNQNINLKIKSLDKIKNVPNPKNYIEEISIGDSNYYRLSDGYFLDLQNAIETYINSLRAGNNRTEFINTIHGILKKSKKDDIIKEIKIYFFE